MTPTPFQICRLVAQFSRTDIELCESLCLSVHRLELGTKAVASPGPRCCSLFNIHFHINLFLIDVLGTVLWLKDLGTFCATHYTNVTGFFMKLTRLNNNDSREFPLKWYLLRWCSFLEMSKTIFRTYLRLKLCTLTKLLPKNVYYIFMVKIIDLHKISKPFNWQS